MALSHLLGQERTARAATEVTNPLATQAPHFLGRAKSVIYLFMTGGPSHLETFDPKPALNKLDGKPLPQSFDVAGLSLQNLNPATSKLLGSPFPFVRSGESGIEISTLFPHLATCATGWQSSALAITNHSFMGPP